jgi:hypothetical protein
VFGDAENYNYEYDKDGVKAALDAKISQQFQQIQNDIRIEFEAAALTEPEEWKNEEN